MVVGVVVLLQPVVPSVKVNVIPAPAAIPVTSPAFVMVAFVASLLTQVPPEFGVRFAVPPIHKFAGGALTTGSALMVAAVVVSLAPVVPSLHVNVLPPPPVLPPT